MNEPLRALDGRAFSPLRTYSQELVPAQLNALRTASLLGAPLLVVFSLVDRLLAPEAFLGLLFLRLVSAALLLVVGQRARRAQGSVLLLCCLGAALLAVPIEIATFATGGARSPYVYSPMLVLAGFAILIPLRRREAILLCVEVIGVAFVPLLLAHRERGDELGLAIAASYLLTVAIISVAGAGVQDALRRREHLARHEFARHAGLVNLGALAGSLAHELANPLSALSLQAEMLEREAPENRTARVQELQQTLERMRNILEAMRGGVRLAGGERRAVDVQTELELAVTLAEGRLRNKIEVRRDYQPVRKLECQPTLLGQLLLNLVMNAADALEQQTGARLTLRLREDEGRAVVEVEDNGPGVPRELRERIFEPFFSTKGEGGNGLGLWISAEIARLHGGSLAIAESDGGGACFKLRLPLS